MQYILKIALILKDNRNLNGNAWKAHGKISMLPSSFHQKSFLYNNCLNIERCKENTEIVKESKRIIQEERAVETQLSKSKRIIQEERTVEIYGPKIKLRINLIHKF